MPRGGKARHVGADLADDAFGAAVLDADDRAQQLNRRRDRADLLLDHGGELFDLLVEEVDVAQDRPNPHAVMLIEAPPQGLSQSGDLLAHLPARQMPVVGQDTEEFVELAMGDGAKLELFGGAEAADGPWMFASNPVVAGFLVDDIESARAELARAPDVELLGELRVMPDGYAWQHFRAPDGHVYELTVDPAAG